MNPTPARRGAEGSFSRRTPWILAAICAVSLLASLLYAAFGAKGPPPKSNNADAFSLSALGHQALAELLKELEIPVLVSRYGSDQRASNGLLLVLEPRLTQPESERARALREMMRTAPAMVLVLPKWSGHTHTEQGAWLQDVRLLSGGRVEAVMASALLSGQVRRYVVDAEEPLRFTSPRFDVQPTFQNVVQVMDSPSVEPLMELPGKGTLIGRVLVPGGSWQPGDGGMSLMEGPGEVWVVSDPDLLSTHGLSYGDNAVLSLAVVEALRPEGGPVIFDETLHGFIAQPSLLREVVGFPLVLAVSQLGLLLIFGVWAGIGRFGAPQKDEPDLPPGGKVLIDQTSKLQQLAGHSQHVFEVYVDRAVAEVGQRLRAPASLSPQRRLEWLAALGKSRGISVDITAVMQACDLAITASRVREAELLELARQVHQWKMELLHGSQRA